MLEIKKKELQVKIFGTNYNLNYPTAKRMAEYAKATRNLTFNSEVSDYDLTEALVVECGLPKDVVEKLDMSDLRELLKHLDGQKKS